MSGIKHAPLPWTQYAGGTQVYGGDQYFVGITQSKNAEADAAFIVLACNSYYETQAALATKDAEIATLKSGIARLSDEEELCAETTGDDPFSMVYLAAKLAKAESENNRLRGLVEEARGCLEGEPEYHSQGMGCGLEDRGITDRYEAMQHGWEQAMERIYGENIAWAKDALASALVEKAHA